MLLNVTAAVFFPAVYIIHYLTHRVMQGSPNIAAANCVYVCVYRASVQPLFYMYVSSVCVS